jgi:hypothetical protein
MIPIEENTELKIGDVILSDSRYFGHKIKQVYAIVDILLGMYVIQDLENVDKKYYLYFHNFIRSSHCSYYLL